MVNKNKVSNVTHHNTIIIVIREWIFGAAKILRSHSGSGSAVAQLKSFPAAGSVMCSENVVLTDLPAAMTR